MALTFREIEEAVNEAQTIRARVDGNTSAMARLIAGRGMLERAYTHSSLTRKTLRDLKNELRRLNTHTGKWRA